ncbi:excisionase family DNA-binding protein [Mycolicibacterium rhodesiae]|uniref:Uncharacterized protein n=1 Tax=Mycolicibacterium rhodesiae TaxID=36814 RepID=A0A1X0IJ28_MYCRH|nr:excisionase family DNA-binding protein [Mycolicibacterium rhodesiae]MCV7342966.1 excisionase family DNA-binding protein [Mycolicibacterium rhodesiae]ORB47764.1 hypothetical protein BST42_27020 [Mycolicibacterium rhodesiae]
MAQPVSDIRPAGRLLSPVREAWEALGCGKTMLYQLVRNGELTLVKIGSRSYIVNESLHAYVARLTEASTTGRAS